MMKEKIRKIYAEELQHPEFSCNDDFYDAGGHSLIMTKIRNRLLSELNIDVAIDVLFRHLTVNDLFENLT